MKSSIFTLIFLAISFAGSAQFCIPVTPDSAQVCPGDSVLISANAPDSLSYQFNDGLLPPGWSATGGSQFSQPCGLGIDGTPYYWASTAGATAPQIVTADLNVACGGFIYFDMVYAVQGGGAPCEGPDLANEGVEVQFSVNNGPWIAITYFSPGGFQLAQNPGGGGGVAAGPTPYTTWNSFIVPIPAIALSPSTKFRWFQEFSSGTCCDNWGIDNMYVDADVCDIGFIDWNSDGVADSSSFWYTPPVASDTFFIADVYDTNGVYNCTSDTVFISTYTNSMTYDLADTLYAFCPTDSLDAEVTNFADAIGPWSVEWSTGDTLNPTTFGTNGNPQDLILYTVDVADGCGFITTDSVWMLVNQTLAIDAVLAFDASACDPDGAVTGSVSGVTQVLGLPFYNWSGPDGSGAFSIDGTATPQILSPGWYVFTVSDDVCEVTDSVYVDVENPPIADFTPLAAEGCSPVVVDFTNLSQNTDTYSWEWGDFTPNSTVDNPSHTFTTTSTVMLISYAPGGNGDCADTAYAEISVVPCGCTDPLALNYNPSATIDNNTCAYPFPTVVAPNIFTPNGDDVNDVYALEVTNAEEVHLIILNRWGNVVFDQRGLNLGWDGTLLNGKKVQEGTFFYKYIIKGIDPSAEPLEGHGFIQVVYNN